MANAVESNAPVAVGWPPRKPAHLLLWWGGLGILLVAEILVLTVCFDAGAADGRSDLASRLVANTPHLLRIAIGTMAGILALAVWRARFRFGEAVGVPGPGSGAWAWLLAHLITFGWLAHCTARVFGDANEPGGLMVLAWFVAAAGTGLLWLAAVFPPRSWPDLCRRQWVMLAGGAAIGLGAWAGGQLLQPLWESSATPTFWAAGTLLRVIYREVVSDPEQFEVGTAGFRVVIGPECSGYEGVGLVCLYVASYLILFRRTLRFPRALWLLPIGAVAVWLLNVVRIACLIVIGDSVSPALALGGFHSQAGWLAFNAVALGSAFVAQRTRLFAPEPAAGPSPTAAYLAPLLAIVAVQMVAEAFFGGSAALYPLRVLAGAAVLAACWRSINGLNPPPLGEGWVARAREAIPVALAALAVFGLWVLSARFHLPDSGQGPPVQPTGLPAWATSGWLIFRAAGSVIVAPLAEEIAFRGYLLRRLIAADFRSVSPRRFTWASFLISSCLFGLLHGRWIVGILAGMVYAAVLYRRGRLGDAVLAHAGTNALLMAVALASGDWSSWS